MVATERVAERGGGELTAAPEWVDDWVGEWVDDWSGRWRDGRRRGCELTQRPFELGLNAVWNHQLGLSDRHRMRCQEVD